LIDYLKKNLDSKHNNFEGQINKILVNNFNKADFLKFADDGKHINILSRQIVEKIETKQVFIFNRDQVISQNQNSIKSDQTLTRTSHSKLDFKEKIINPMSKEICR